MSVHVYLSNQRGSITENIKVEVTKVEASGSSLTPRLRFGFNFTKVFNDGTTSHINISNILGLSIKLSSEDLSLSTGWLPMDYTIAAELELNHNIIDILTSKAETRHNNKVIFHLKLILLIDVNAEIRVFNSDVHEAMVEIDSIDWANKTKFWGYPEKRFVPISWELPQPLTSERLQKRWSYCVGKLISAQDNWRLNRVFEAGQCLRESLEEAMFTWYLLWNEDAEDAPSEWVTAARAVGNNIPGFDKQTWQLKKDVGPDVERIYSWFIALKDLKGISNQYHHRTSVRDNSRPDVDMLISATTSIIRNLPDVWMQYPTPIVNAQENTN